MRRLAVAGGCLVTLLAAVSTRVDSLPLFYPDDIAPPAAVGPSSSSPSLVASFSKGKQASGVALSAPSADNVAGAAQSLAPSSFIKQMNEHSAERRIDAVNGTLYQDNPGKNSTGGTAKINRLAEDGTVHINLEVKQNCHSQLVFDMNISELSAAEGQTLFDNPSGEFLFPDWREHSNFSAQVTPMPSCDGRTISAVHPVTGSCQLLGSAAGCPDEQLLLLDHQSGQPACRAPPCPQHHVLFCNACRPANDPLACPEGMTLTQDEYGDGVCDCRSGHVPWPATGRCYPALRQGPCPIGRYLTQRRSDINEEIRPICANNVCIRDGSLLWSQPPAAGCYPLQQPDAGCESEQLLKLNVTIGQLVCEQLEIRAIFDLPAMRCPDESLQDFSGRCRRRMMQGFRHWRR